MPIRTVLRPLVLITLCLVLAAPAAAQDAAFPATPPARAVSTAPRADDLALTVTGLRGRGAIVVALTNSKAQYETNTYGEAGPFRKARVAAEGAAAEVVFEDVPHGTYAIKLFYDENGNRQLDTNFLGIPSEPYGFSNNARGRFGPPDYEEAAFAFDAEHAAVEIRVR